MIGGIVDHNRLKSITFDFAKANGIAARRLPMHGVRLKASVHLAVNHVWEWMLHHFNGLTWDQALRRVIPSRKLHHYEENQQNEEGEEKTEEKGEEEKGGEQEGD